MKDNHEADLRNRIRQSFMGSTVHQVLDAYDCATERLGKAVTGQTQAAEILLSQHADPVVVTGALLAPLRRHGLIEDHEIRDRFGEVLATLVEEVFSEEILRTDSEVHREEDLRRFLQSISASLRAVVLRIGLRLAELESLVDADDDGEHRDMARETLELYVPLADRMGMGALRTRLEDTSFQLLEPAIYEELVQKIEPIRSRDELCLDLLKHNMHGLLRKHGVESSISGRVKGLYSLYNKMCRLDCTPQDILDKVGLRIIVSSVEECYAVLGLLHTHFRPVPGTFDDYIGFPKANGYQSLHTSVYPVPDISAKPVEFQIRTEAMHREAEYGVAAHWLYKHEDETVAERNGRLQWLRSLPSQQEEAADYAEFVQCLYHQVFGDQEETSSTLAASSPHLRQWLPWKRCSQEKPGYCG